MVYLIPSKIKNTPLSTTGVIFHQDKIKEQIMLLRRWRKEELLIFRDSRAWLYYWQRLIFSSRIMKMWIMSFCLYTLWYFCLLSSTGVFWDVLNLKFSLWTHRDDMNYVRVGWEIHHKVRTSCNVPKMYVTTVGWTWNFNKERTIFFIFLLKLKLK